MHNIVSYQSFGPYFSPSKGRYQAARLRDLIFHVRQCMEDDDDYIGIFNGNECLGIWSREHDVQSDGEGGLEAAGKWYELHRPDGSHPGTWNAMLKVVK